MGLLSLSGRSTSTKRHFIWKMCVCVEPAISPSLVRNMLAVGIVRPPIAYTMLSSLCEHNVYIFKHRNRRNVKHLPNTPKKRLKRILHNELSVERCVRQTHIGRRIKKAITISSATAEWMKRCGRRAKENAVIVIFYFFSICRYSCNVSIFIEKSRSVSRTS